MPVFEQATPDIHVDVDEREAIPQSHDTHDHEAQVQQVLAAADPRDPEEGHDQEVDIHQSNEQIRSRDKSERRSQGEKQPIESREHSSSPPVSGLSKILLFKFKKVNKKRPLLRGVF